MCVCVCVFHKYATIVISKNSKELCFCERSFWNFIVGFTSVDSQRRCCLGCCRALGCHRSRATLRICGVLHLFVCITSPQLVEGSWGLYHETKATSADMAGGSKGWRRRCTCPQLQPSLSCPAWPLTPVGSSPSLRGLYVSCHCPPLLSSPGQGSAAQKVQSVIKSRGHRGPAGGGARELKQCPPQGKKKKRPQ